VGKLMYRISSRSIPYFLLILIFLVSHITCAHKGLVVEKYPEKIYSVPKLMPDVLDKNPTFIIYGDSRPGWQLHEKFLNRKNWLSWRVILFPYWLATGAIGGINRLRHTPDFGSKENRMVRDAIYDEAKRSHVNFILHAGDIATDGRRPKHWKTFLHENKIEHPLLEEFPYLPTVGNHEWANDLTYGLFNYQAVFSYPQFYVVDFPDAALFFVDSNVIIDGYRLIENDKQDELFQRWFISGEESDTPAWLERELAVRNKAFKIVVMHHPLISFGKHHKDWTNRLYGENLQIKRQKLLKLFREQGVQIVISGHEHLYEHNILRYRLDGSKLNHEIHFIVSGGGGSPLHSQSDAKKLAKYRQNYRREGLDVLSVIQERIYHYCLVQIEHDRVTIEVFQVTGDPAQPVSLVERITVVPHTLDNPLDTTKQMSLRSRVGDSEVLRRPYLFRLSFLQAFSSVFVFPSHCGG